MVWTKLGREGMKHLAVPEILFMHSKLNLLIIIIIYRNF